MPFSFKAAVQALQASVQAGMMAVTKKGVALAPDRLVPGGVPDPIVRQQHGKVDSQVARVDGPSKVTGTAPFAAEIALDRLCHAAVACSTIPRGRITRLDVEAAEAAPGVILVMTYRNAPRMKPPQLLLATEKGASADGNPVMQDDRIHWNGQPVAVVLAESLELADHAAGLVTVDYAEEHAVTSLDEARDLELEQGSMLGEPLRDVVGDADGALDNAAVRVDATYRTQRQNHAAIELHATTLEWQADRLIVHDSSQMVTHSAATLADMFGIDEDRVVVTSPFVGGGFGGKSLWQHQPLAAAAAKLAGRPVRLVLSREGVNRLVGGRAVTEQRVALGAGQDGRLEALIQEGLTTKSRSTVLIEPFILGTRPLYAAPAIRLDVKAAHLDEISNTFVRGPGEAPGSFALESAMDELALAAGLDPIELRRRNEPDRDPISGLPFSSRNLLQCYRDGAGRFGWTDGPPGIRARREGEWLVGSGCATAVYHYARMPGASGRLTLNVDGTAMFEIAAHEMGMGTQTIHEQAMAERLGLSMDRVSFRYGDSRLPGMVMAGGSQQTAAIGASLADAHDRMIAELLTIAGNDSPLAGCRPADVEARDGGLCRRSAPDQCESYRSILTRAQRPSLSVVSEPSMPVEAMHWSMHSYAAMFCEVRVNAVTGELRVSRFLGAFDCGRILNARTAIGQFRGGIIMGLGLALMEAVEHDDRRGRVVNASLAEYHVPVHADVPEIEVMWTDIPDPHTPMGARGIGEIGTCGVAAAVANAVYDATGIRVRDLPITLDKLLAELPIPA